MHAYRKNSDVATFLFRRQKGFTLLEALAALAIITLGLEAIVRAGSVGVTSARREYAQMEAVARAQSHLAALMDPAALAPSSLSGPDGGGYTYATRVALVDVARPLRPLRLSGGVQALETALFKVDVTIAWKDGAANPSVSLSSYAIAPVQP